MQPLGGETDIVFVRAMHGPAHMRGISKRVLKSD
jgi:hypothetical protein